MDQVHGTKKLCTDDKLVLEMEENFEGKTLALSRSISIPPRCTAVVEVTCLSKMDGKFQVQPSPVLLRDNPNVYCKPIVYNMTPDKAQIEEQNAPKLPTSEGHVEFNNIEPMNTPALPSNRKKKKKASANSHEDSLLHHKLKFIIQGGFTKRSHHGICDP